MPIINFIMFNAKIWSILVFHPGLEPEKKAWSSFFIISQVEPDLFPYPLLWAFEPQLRLVPPPLLTVKKFSF